MGRERGEPRTGRDRGPHAGSARAAGGQAGTRVRFPGRGSCRRRRPRSRSTTGLLCPGARARRRGWLTPSPPTALPRPSRRPELRRRRRVHARPGSRAPGLLSGPLHRAGPAPLARPASGPGAHLTPGGRSVPRLHLFTYRDALRAAGRAPGDAEPSRQRPLGRPDPPSGFRCRHFRPAVQPHRAGVRGGSETNSARGSSGARWRRRWAGGGDGGGDCTCSPRPVETVGGRPPRGEEQRLGGPTWEAARGTRRGGGSMAEACVSPLRAPPVVHTRGGRRKSFQISLVVWRSARSPGFRMTSDFRF